MRPEEKAVHYRFVTTKKPYCYIEEDRPSAPLRGGSPSKWRICRSICPSNRFKRRFSIVIKGRDVLNLLSRSILCTAALGLALGLCGCGVTKLWGGSEPGQVGSAARGEMTLREYAATVSEPLWEVESKGSWFGRIAGVLISGKEEADTATAAFELTGNEDETVQQAAGYLKDRGEGAKDLSEIAQRVSADAKRRIHNSMVFWSPRNRPCQK